MHEPRNQACTRSRDIRAPNLSELYAPGASDSNNITDTVLTKSCSALTVTAGDLNLTPEVTTTNSVGAVFTPTFFPGFTTPVDYYDINIATASTSVKQA